MPSPLFPGPPTRQSTNGNRGQGERSNHDVEAWRACAVRWVVVVVVMVMVVVVVVAAPFVR